MGHDFTVIRREQNPAYGEESSQPVLQQLESKEKIIQKERYLQQHLFLPKEANEQAPKRLKGSLLGGSISTPESWEGIVRLPPLPSEWGRGSDCWLVSTPPTPPSRIQRGEKNNRWIIAQSYASGPAENGIGLSETETRAALTFLWLILPGLREVFAIAWVWCVNAGDWRVGGAGSGLQPFWTSAEPIVSIGASPGRGKLLLAMIVSLSIIYSSKINLRIWVLLKTSGLLLKIYCAAYYVFNTSQ